MYMIQSLDNYLQRTTRVLALGLVVFSLAFLLACSNEQATPTEAPRPTATPTAVPTATPTAVPTATPTVQASGLTRGRLVATSATLPEVYVVDLDTFEVSTLPVEAASGILQGTGGISPYSWMVHYADNRVEIVDVGIELTRHQAHYHIDKTDPEIHSFSMTGPNPAHIVEHGGLVAVFFDGTGEVRLVTEDQLTSGGEVDVDTLMANLPHHGVALDFHEHMLVTRAETIDGAPNINGVVAYAHDDTSTTVHETEATCNNLQKASLGEYIGFADEGAPRARPRHPDSLQKAVVRVGHTSSSPTRLRR